MPIYQEKRLPVEAVQFTQQIRDAYLFNGADLPAGVRRTSSHTHPPSRTVYSCRFVVDSPKGIVEIEVGDWVIKDSTGYFVCAPDLFEQTYELIPEEDLK